MGKTKRDVLTSHDIQPLVLTDDMLKEICVQVEEEAGKLGVIYTGTKVIRDDQKDPKLPKIYATLVYPSNISPQDYKEFERILNKKGILGISKPLTDSTLLAPFYRDRNFAALLIPLEKDTREYQEWLRFQELHRFMKNDALLLELTQQVVRETHTLGIEYIEPLTIEDDENEDARSGVYAVLVFPRDLSPDDFSVLEKILKEKRLNGIAKLLVNTGLLPEKYRESHSALLIPLKKATKKYHKQKKN